MIFPSTDYGRKGANLKVRKLLGRAYLRENRIGEALEVYLGILSDYPDDADVLIILGNLYGLSGSPATAGLLYQRVLAANPEAAQVIKQIQAAQEQTNREWEPADPLSEETIACLVDRLQARTGPDRAAEIRTSAEILDQTVVEENPAESSGNGHHATSGQPALAAGQPAPLTEEVQQLLPALIAQNIRQARAAGFIELAELLQSLQINLARQVEDRWADDLLNDEPLLDKNLNEE